MTATPRCPEPCAQLPDRYGDRQVAASTVDALGRARTRRPLPVPPAAETVWLRSVARACAASDIVRTASREAPMVETAQEYP